MLAPTQGASVALPNLAFALILNSVQNAPAALRTPSHNPGTRPSPPPLADSHQVQHIDVKA